MKSLIRQVVAQLAESGASTRTTASDPRVAAQLAAVDVAALTNIRHI